MRPSSFAVAAVVVVVLVLLLALVLGACERTPTSSSPPPPLPPVLPSVDVCAGAASPAALAAAFHRGGMPEVQRVLAVSLDGKLPADITFCRPGEPPEQIPRVVRVDLYQRELDGRGGERVSQWGDASAVSGGMIQTRNVYAARAGEAPVIGTTPVIGLVFRTR